MVAIDVILVGEDSNSDDNVVVSIFTEIILVRNDTRENVVLLVYDEVGMGIIRPFNFSKGKRKTSFWYKWSFRKEESF